MPLLIVKKRILNVISRKAAPKRCLFLFAPNFVPILKEKAVFTAKQNQTSLIVLHLNFAIFVGNNILFVVCNTVNTIIVLCVFTLMMWYDGLHQG